MKTEPGLALGVVCGLSLAVQLAMAGAGPEPWYIRASVGATWSQDTGVRSLQYDGRELLPNHGTEEIHYGTGFGLGLEWGRRLWGGLALEAETGLYCSPIDSFEGSREGDGFLGQVPLLINLVFEYEGFDRFRPYVGAGAGGIANLIHVEYPFTAGEYPDRLSFSEFGFVLAWHALAGVQYRMNDRLLLGVHYGFFASAAQDWTGESVNWFWTDEEHRWRIATEEIFTHSVTAAVTFRF